MKIITSVKIFVLVLSFLIFYVAFSSNNIRISENGVNRTIADRKFKDTKKSYLFGDLNLYDETNSTPRIFKSEYLHKIAKQWLMKVGVPKEIPPSAWCDSDGIVISIPISSILKKKLINEISALGIDLHIIDETTILNANLTISDETKGSCSKAFIVEEFYEISGNKKVDAIFIKSEKSCEDYSFSTHNYKYSVYSVDPLDKKIWSRSIDSSNKESDKIGLASMRLPSKFTVIAVCSCCFKGKECYPNVRWSNVVRAGIIKSNEIPNRENGKEFQKAKELPIYGMLISSIFTAGEYNEVNVPNNEEDLIFDNHIDRRYTENCYPNIYLWPSYCEYIYIKNQQDQDKHLSRVPIVVYGCPSSKDISFTILLNIPYHLIFSISKKKLIQEIDGDVSDYQISLKCAMQTFAEPQSLSKNCSSVLSFEQPNLLQGNSKYLPLNSWRDINTKTLTNQFKEDFNIEKIQLEDTEVSKNDYSNKRWSSEIWNSNVKMRRLAQPNPHGMKSHITGKTVMKTPTVGTNQRGDKAYLLFNKNMNSHMQSVDRVASEQLTEQYYRSMPQLPVVHAIFQNLLWRDWLIRYAPLVGSDGNFIRVGRNYAFAFIGDSYIEQAVTYGMSYNTAIFSFLSAKALTDLGRFFTFGYTQGLYGVRIDRSNTLNAWGIDLQSRYLISSTLATFGLREYAQHITLRDISLSARHNFSPLLPIISGQQFSTEAIASYKTLFIDVATNVKQRSYGVAIGLRGYQFTVVRSFTTRTTDLLGNWGNGWQLLLSSTFPTDNDPSVIARAGAGRLGRSFVLAGAGVGSDLIPVVSFQTQLDDVGVIIEFSPGIKDRIFAFGIEVNHFAYFWESIFTPKSIPVPLVLGIEPEDLSKVVFGQYAK
ncbi:uncharacterized protein CMU_041130 [Cryptosporidium muris RN66]|uniref:Uncharacterized protein n=1 Tax=Cryptosporidium muris (strain RN66) TaxID=441375 RepID=B6AA02_CRYMR|nr:uncharacterized protein CMU_041130 [Cryptosporidium muris RN66]EEA05043.1 hypothetical protein CMU_041130 [Cryptosporidium muris RN66]|eukprot:XP_002139392.1 hypothetical protein [Cryptosporidium muris RN66]